ncbi:MAG: hypothetical protein ACN2B6_12135 [Rickettsiales bacterium]
MQSLSELKAENEELETEVTDTEEVLEADEEQIEEGDAVDAEQATDDLEEWQKEDGEIAPMFTSSDIAAAKKNLRAKLDRKHESEVESLRAEIEELKSQNIRPKAPVKAPDMPNRDDFESDTEYFQKLNEWNQKAVEDMYENRQKEEATKARQAETQNRTNQAVDQHYERAVKLTQESGISEDVYKSSDLAVRTMAESVAPGKGDFVIEQLISRLGEGSEKVMFYVGRNKSALNELQVALSEDPSGLQAAMLMGSMKARVAMPKKRQSSAAQPATQLKGDANASEDAASLKRKYQKASKAGDVQTSFSVRRKAKKAGVDVSKW